MWRIKKTNLYIAVVLTLVSYLLTIILPFKAFAVDELGNFSLQVTPSPIVESVKPGETKVVELKIRNNGNKTENLKIETKGFIVKDDDKDISLLDTAPMDVSEWIKFANPTFTIKSGEWFTERITLSPPKNAGFSYSFAFVISRVQNAQAQPGTPAIKGSLAVFTLINIERPDAKRELSVANFSASKNVYEYLPALFTIKFKNSGNTIVQPYGNIYIQRSKNSANPISVLPVNEGKGYILPNTERSLKASWSDGSPVYITEKTADNSQEKTKLSWNWDNLDHFRIGKYYAKVVAVYNDGQRDVPIEGVLSFWIIPWKIILGALIILALIVVGIFTIIKKIIGLKKRPIKNSNED